MFALYAGYPFGYYIYPGCYLLLKNCGEGLVPKSYKTRAEAQEAANRIYIDTARRCEVRDYPDLSAEKVA